LFIFPTDNPLFGKTRGNIRNIFQFWGLLKQIQDYLGAKSIGTLKFIEHYPGNKQGIPLKNYVLILGLD